MLNQQSNNRSNQYKCKERVIQLVIASKYPAKPFDLLKETLDQMSFPVGVVIHWPRFRGVVLRRYGIARLLTDDIISDCFCAISLVAKDVAVLDLNLTEQWYGVFGIMIITTAEQKGNRIP